MQIFDIMNEENFKAFNALKELTNKYQLVCSSEQTNLQRKVKQSFRRKLKENGISYRELDTIFSLNQNSSEGFNEIIEKSSFENKELCLQYLDFLDSSSNLRNSKVKLKGLIGQQMSKIDSIFIDYLLYRLDCKKARERLEKKLKNLTIEDLDKKYKNIVEI